jgi:oxalate decarboxylase/phosphoglucose isomerase-like protein (cupin superfamily)
VYQIINLPKILDERGNLSFFENEHQIPFSIARTYWIYDVPGGDTRGGHAFRKQQEVIIALSGSLDIVLHDGKSQHTVQLNRSYNALYVKNGIWRHMENFSTNSLVLVVSDLPFDAADYIRDWNEFLIYTHGK